MKYLETTIDRWIRSQNIISPYKSIFQINVRFSSHLLRQLNAAECPKYSEHRINDKFRWIRASDSCATALTLWSCQKRCLLKWSLRIVIANQILKSYTKKCGIQYTIMYIMCEPMKLHGRSPEQSLMSRSATITQYPNPRQAKHAFYCLPFTPSSPIHSNRRQKKLFFFCLSVSEKAKTFLQKLAFNWQKVTVLLDLWNMTYLVNEKQFSWKLYEIFSTLRKIEEEI